MNGRQDSRQPARSPRLGFAKTRPDATGAPTPTLSHGVSNAVNRYNKHVVLMGLLMSLAGFEFGYEAGSIAGYLLMEDFVRRFGRSTSANGSRSLGEARTGYMVSFLCIGCLIGSLASAPFADKYGRKRSIIAWNMVYIVGNLLTITTFTAWWRIPIGRFVGGLGIGALSVLTPMYLSETAPRQVRGVLVASYQLLITVGIFAAYCVNFGTRSLRSAASWRITMGCGFLSPVIMAIGVCFLRESPRWDFRHDRHDAAAQTLAVMSHVPIHNSEVQHELHEITEQFIVERATDETRWYRAFKAPAMRRRILIGVFLQASQQWTGANFFIYFGTSTFATIGLSDPYVTSIVLGAVNFASTIVGLWVCQRFGRRIALITGGVWMFVCLMIYASLGTFAIKSSSIAGTVMIIFTCLFLFGFAITSGVLIWVVCGEMFPNRHRATAMAICTASNWLNNFVIAFCTPFITNVIGYAYGYVFAGCNLLAAVLIYFLVIESQGRSLEEVDMMYVLGVVPRKSAKWHASDPSPAVGASNHTPGADPRQMGKAASLGTITEVSQES